MSGLQRIVVAGAGAFGTALGCAAVRAGRDVTLVARSEEQAAAMRESGENAAYLPGIRLPAALRISADIGAAREADAILLVAPAQATRTLAERLAPHVAPGIPVIACAKGIERETGALQSDIIGAVLPTAMPASLSGPGFAEEIAAGLPTAVTIAAADIQLARALAEALSSDRFRPYASDDLIGVELGGAAKNVLAIACGVVAGRTLGESARAALIARGLAEMTRLGVALGARPETFMGLSGLGDLVLTATSGQSRNTRFGEAIGRGARASDLIGPGLPLVEGALTAPVAAALAESHGIDAPIIAAVAAIVGDAISVDAAIEGLVSRPLKEESMSRTW